MDGNSEVKFDSASDGHGHSPFISIHYQPQSQALALPCFAYHSLLLSARLDGLVDCGMGHLVISSQLSNDACSPSPWSETYLRIRVTVRRRLSRMATVP